MKHAGLVGRQAVDDGVDGCEGCGVGCLGGVTADEAGELGDDCCVGLEGGEG